MAITDDVERIQHSLQKLFDSAAAKSLVVINQDDAEPEMVAFLHAVKSYPDQRSFVNRLFIESFSDRFYMKWAPWEFMQFCMHDLRWPEIREFIKTKKDEDVRTHGARSSTIWNDILEAFEDHWAGAKFFKEFDKKPQ